MAAFQFEPGFQRSILRLMMIDDVFCMRALQHVRASFFTIEALGWIFTTYTRYWEAYHRRCTEVPLRDALRYVPLEKIPVYYADVELVIGMGGVPEADYVKAQLADFCRRNLFSAAHQESAALFNESKSVEAYDVMARAQDEIRKVDFGDVDRSWFFEELADRQYERARMGDFHRGYSTGIPELDKLTGGGVQAGEVWAVLAYAKRCKTTWLTNIGFSTIRQYAEPVLHILLEGRRQEITAKYDSLFSNELYTKVKVGEIDPRLYASLQYEYQQNRKLLVVRTLNDWDVNILQIKAELDELRGHDFRPSMLILDYVDLLRSRYRADTETKHQVEASRDLKRLINTSEMACWTAWQAQRPKDNAHLREHILTSGAVADAYAKVRIVDAYGSLNATDEEMERGEMRVHWEAHRTAPVHKTWVITNDLSRQRMVTSVLAASTAPAAEA